MMEAYGMRETSNVISTIDECDNCISLKSFRYIRLILSCVFKSFIFYDSGKDDRTFYWFFSVRTTLRIRNGTHLGITSSVFNTLPLCNLHLDPSSRNLLLERHCFNMRKHGIVFALSQLMLHYSNVIYDFVALESPSPPSPPP